MADIKFIAGEGKPRLVRVNAYGNAAFAGSTVFTSTSATITNIGLSARENQRVSSYKVIAGQPNKLVWAKVTAVASNDEVTLDAWVGGTPTNGQTVTIDGWVVDLPYCNENGLQESFAPINLLHGLWKNRKDSRFDGYEYSCKLMYEEFIEANTILALRPILNAGREDKIIFVPRADRPGRNYNVYNAEKIAIARHVEQGHKLFSIGLKGKETTVFPIPNSGYGFGYATHYGSQL